MLGKYIDQGLNFKPWDVSVGKAAVLLVGLGFTDAIAGLIAGLVGNDNKDYPCYANIGLGVVLPRIEMLKNFFGPNGTELLSVAAIANGLNGLLNIEDSVRTIIQEWTSSTPTSQVSAPVRPQRTYQLPSRPTGPTTIRPSLSAPTTAPTLSKPASQPERKVLSRLNLSTVPAVPSDIGQALERLMAV